MKTGNADFDVDLKPLESTKKVRCLQCPEIKFYHQSVNTLRSLMRAGTRQSTTHSQN
jgi:hypothetical protein